MSHPPDADEGRDAAPQAPAAPPLRRRLISAGVWSFVGRGAAIGLFFLTDAVLARALSKGDFAAYYLATQATVFMAGLVALGSPQILSRTLRQVIYGPHSELAPAVIRACTRVLALGCALGAVVFFAVRPWVVEEGAQWSLFREAPWGIVLWSCLAAACLNSAFALQGLDDFRSAALVGSRRGGVLPNLAFLTFAFAAWQLGMIDLKALIVAQVAFQALALAWGRRAIRRRLASLGAAPGAGRDARGDDARAETSTLWQLREGLPYFASILVTLALDELDGLWVGRLVTDAATTADYGAAKRLVRLITTPYVMFAMSLAPFTAELLAKGEKERLERILRAAAALVSLPMIIALVAFLVAPGTLLAVALGEQYRNAAPILQWLAVGQLVYVPLGFSSQVLLMGGRQTSLMYVSAGALGGYCLLMPWATSEFGAPGAAAVQTAAFAGSAVATFWLARRQLGVWTAATWRPAEIRAALQILIGRRRRPETTPPAAGDELRN